MWIAVKDRDKNRSLTKPECIDQNPHASLVTDENYENDNMHIEEAVAEVTTKKIPIKPKEVTFCKPLVTGMKFIKANNEGQKVKKRCYEKILGQKKAPEKDIKQEKDNEIPSTIEEEEQTPCRLKRNQSFER